jgi:hypothetical protein
MNPQQASQLLRLYRPGEGLEESPEMRTALRMAEEDPALQALIGADRHFDEAMTSALCRLRAPDYLHARLLNEVRESFVSDESKNTADFAWFHWLAFGSAAVLTFSLALFFTFWSPPSRPPADSLPQLESPFIAEAENRTQTTLAEAEILPESIMDMADSLFASLQPRIKGSHGNEMHAFIRAEGGPLPQTLPPGFSWDASVACDVLRKNGAVVSVICFESPDKSGKLHLFTFRRQDFPHIQTDRRPVVHERKKGCCATWGDDKGIHVLYSDSGRKNLHLALDI